MLLCNSGVLATPQLHDSRDTRECAAEKAALLACNAAESEALYAVTHA